ncbi:MAG: hypothetical protein KOO62_08425 [candidate division Zixibacteria bacterium]|nr:hypothetical protein [candidate division Zixibacteria bacterium]
MKLMRYTCIILLGTYLAIAFCACSARFTTYTVLKAYPGPELRGENRHALVLRESDGGSYICGVDGRDTTENGEGLVAYGVLLLPGAHDLEVRYHKSDIYLNGQLYKAFSKDPVTLHVDVKAGHTYSLFTRVEPYRESKKLYSWEPYLHDITGESGFILTEAPRRPYQFSLSAPNSRVSFVITPPETDKWLMHRRADKSDFPIILDFFRCTGMLKPSCRLVYVILNEQCVDPSHNVINEDWISKFLMEFVFREWAPRQLPIDIESRKFMQIGENEYYEVICQSIFRDAIDTESHSFFILYLPKREISGELSPIFVAMSDADKNHIEENIQTVLDMISSMQCESKK